MKAIRTSYSGILFRSKLEARWAVFFDALGIAWEYEAEGYELDDGTKYLPDFWLPKFNGGVYVEIKPPDDPFLKSYKFALEASRPIWLCDGAPRWRTWTVLSPVHGTDEDGTKQSDVWVDQQIPLVDHARMEHRMFYQADCFYGGNEEEWKATASEGRRWEPELFAAFDRARTYSFWEPEARP